ncbi:MAG: NAD-dependent epimerase/dehydratase family protein [Nitrosopumilaceae archaeon]
MKIFVTGGAGFIGRHLVDSLLKAGNVVTIYDNFKNNSEGKVAYLVKNGASVVKGDVTDYELLSKEIAGSDCAIHLAAEIDVQESIKNPQNTNQVNVTGTVNLLRACVSQKVRNVVAASSAAVFGNSKDLPLSENSKHAPITPYGASKLCIEYYMQAFSNSFDLNCITLRFFNVYGCGQSEPYADVITRFMEQIATNKPLVIFGDGTQTRDFVSVFDVVQSIQNAIKKIDGKRGNVYNIASGKYVSIQDLANLMLSISGKTLPIEYKKAKKGDIHDSQTSIWLAQRELEYFPKVQLEDGLKMLLYKIV